MRMQTPIIYFPMKIYLQNSQGWVRRLVKQSKCEAIESSRVLQLSNMHDSCHHPIGAARCFNVCLKTTIQLYFPCSRKKFLQHHRWNIQKLRNEDERGVMKLELVCNCRCILTVEALHIGNQPFGNLTTLNFPQIYAYMQVHE
jgi:hypothetical protein